MNRDRSEYNGGSPSSDGDDHEVDLTGEFEIVYTPPAWYAQSTQGGSSPSGQPEPPAPPPPTGTPIGTPTGPPGVPAGPGPAPAQGTPAAPQQGQTPQTPGGYGFPQQQSGPGAAPA